MEFLLAFLGCLVAIEVRNQVIRTVVIPILSWSVLRRARGRRARATTADQEAGAGAVAAGELARGSGPGVYWGLIRAALEHDRTKDDAALASAAQSFVGSLSTDERRMLASYFNAGVPDPGKEEQERHG